MLEVIMINIPTLPLAKAVRASVASHVTAFGSTILYSVAQSNQNLVPLCTCGVSSSDVFRSFETKSPPICLTKVQMIFQGSYESAELISAPYTLDPGSVIFWASSTNSVQVFGGLDMPALSKY